MNSKIESRFNKKNLLRGIQYFKRNGLRETYYKAMERLHRDEGEVDYGEVRLSEIPSKEELQQQRMKVFSKNYKFSILVPAYETPEPFLKQMLQSVMNQSYDNWELCIADGSESDSVKKIIMEMVGRCFEYAGADRIRYRKLDKNRGISENTNAALDMATGDYIGLLDHDDLLTPDALYRIMEAINHNELEEDVCALYSDEDKVNQDLTKYFDCHKKLDFNLDLLRSNNYICHFFIVKTEVAREIGGFNSDYNGAQDYDFILRCVEAIERDGKDICFNAKRMKKILHVPKVLYHWRSHEQSTAENPESKMYAYEAGRKALEAHLERCNIKADVMHTVHLGFYRVVYALQESVEDTLIVAPIDKLLKISKASWDQLKPEEVEALPYDYFMIKSDNLKAVSKDWERELLGTLQRREVGAVGCKIYGRKRKIESAGYYRDEAGHMIPNFQGMNASYSGYLHRASLQQVVDGIALDCMMLKKSAILFGEKMHMSKKYLIVYDPYVEFQRKK